MKSFIIIGLLLVFLVLFSGCISLTNPTKKETIIEKTEVEAREECIKLCKEKKTEGINLEAGPCLSDNEKRWQIESYVCDVAHWPRTEIDNMKANQCRAYGVTAKHFIEVDPNCNFIRSA